MKLRKKNLELLKKFNVYHENMEHDACGVGLVASTNGYYHCRLKSLVLRLLVEGQTSNNL